MIVMGQTCANGHPSESIRCQLEIDHPGPVHIWCDSTGMLHPKTWPVRPGDREDPLRVDQERMLEQLRMQTAAYCHDEEVQVGVPDYGTPEEENASEPTPPVFVDTYRIEALRAAVTLYSGIGTRNYRSAMEAADQFYTWLKAKPSGYSVEDL